MPNALWALQVYPVVEDEKLNGSDEKLHKKTDRTNIIATNFVWEQLIKTSNKLKYTDINCYG